MWAFEPRAAACERDRTLACTGRSPGDPIVNSWRDPLPPTSPLQTLEHPGEQFTIIAGIPIHTKLDISGCDLARLLGEISLKHGILGIEEWEMEGDAPV